MLREAFRVLRRGGRFALYNMCPQESDNWLYYAYFPEAKTRDFADFWPPDAIVSELSATGFAGVEVARRHVHRERDLTELQPCSSASGIRNCYRCPTRRMRPGCGVSSATSMTRKGPKCSRTIFALSRYTAIEGRSRKFGLTITAPGRVSLIPVRPGEGP
jgi:hypothetical protein